VLRCGQDDFHSQNYCNIHVHTYKSACCSVRIHHDCMLHDLEVAPNLWKESSEARKKVGTLRELVHVCLTHYKTIPTTRFDVYECSFETYRSVCCSVLQCVAVCCSVWQRVAVCCSVLQRVAACCSVLQCVTTAVLRV